MVKSIYGPQGSAWHNQTRATARRAAVAFRTSSELVTHVRVTAIIVAQNNIIIIAISPPQITESLYIYIYIILFPYTVADCEFFSSTRPSVRVVVVVFVVLSRRFPFKYTAGMGRKFPLLPSCMGCPLKTGAIVAGVYGIVMTDNHRIIFLITIIS